MRQEAAGQVNSLLQVTLENAMLKRDLQGLEQIVDRLGAQPGVERVMIANPLGEVRFSSDASRLGHMLWEGALPYTAPEALFMADPAGGDLLRSINPVPNRTPCTPCHGSVATKPFNGVLFVDYAAAPLRDQAFRTTLLLMGAGAVVVVATLIGGWWFMRRFVLRPVERLSRASEALAGGDLSARVALAGNDELAQLGADFNAMAASLQASVNELEEEERFLQALIDTIPDGVRIFDAEGRLVLANRTYCAQLGLDPGCILGQRCWESAHGAQEPCAPTLKPCPLDELAAAGKAQEIRFVDRHRRADGALLEVEITAAAVTLNRRGRPQRLIIESIRDLEAQVRFSHEQKMAELGRLSAGVAHEIHNPLASVRLALGSLRSDPEAARGCSPLVADYLQLVDREVDKCIDVTDRLLKLSSPPGIEEELVDLGRAAEETLSLLRWEAKQASVQLETAWPEPPLRVLAADSEMRMVILNLAQNAFHAMPKGGRLRIRGERAAGTVRVVITDTGAGIAASEQQRIFYPFFSRRADGSSGSGLGLFICRSILRSRGGALELESEPGRGSCFTVILPDADRP